MLKVTKDIHRVLNNTQGEGAIYSISGHGVSLLLQLISRAQNECEMPLGQSAQTTTRAVSVALC